MFKDDYYKIIGESKSLFINIFFDDECFSYCFEYLGESIVCEGDCYF